MTLRTPVTRQWLLDEADRLLTGAQASAAHLGDGAPGGFWWLDPAGAPDRERGRQLWITTRMTHCFALGQQLGRDGDTERVEHGLRSLLGAFADGEHGGWYHALDASGSPDRAAAKGAYGHAFVVLAGASAALAGHDLGRELLGQALQVQERYFWDDAAGAVVEEWDAAFAACDPYRGANANMHTVEAYLAAADATGDRRWRDRALRIAQRLVHVGARGHQWRVPEHFDAGWQELPDYNADAPAHPFRPYGVTPGHGLEWARLLLHLRASLTADGLDAPSWLGEAATGLFDRALADGWDDTGGGIAYTTDWSGRPVVEQRFHWVVCEAIAAAWALHLVTGEQRFADWYTRLWAYAQRSYIDPAVPGWQHEVNPDGSPSTRTWTGRPDVYHALQATLVPLLPLTPVFAATVGTLRPA